MSFEYAPFFSLIFFLSLLFLNFIQDQIKEARYKMGQNFPRKFCSFFFAEEEALNMVFPNQE